MYTVNGTLLNATTMSQINIAAPFGNGIFMVEITGYLVISYQGSYFFEVGRRESIGKVDWNLFCLYLPLLLQLPNLSFFSYFLQVFHDSDINLWLDGTLALSSNVSSSSSPIQTNSFTLSSYVYSLFQLVTIQLQYFPQQFTKSPTGQVTALALDYVNGLGTQLITLPSVSPSGTGVFVLKFLPC